MKKSCSHNSVIVFITHICVFVCVCVCVCDDYVLIYWKFQVIDIVVHFGVSYLGLIKRKKLNEMKLNETHHF